MTRITRWVLNHKLIVIFFWVALTLVGFAFVQRATNSLSQQFSLPGQQAYETNLKIIKLYGNGGFDPPIVPEITLPRGAAATSRAIRSRPASICTSVPRCVLFAMV